MAAVTLAIQNGLVMAFAVIYLPLITEFGGSRAEVAMVQSAVFLVGGVSGPLIGWAFDRLGPNFDATGSYLAAVAGPGTRVRFGVARTWPCARGPARAVHVQ